MPTPIGRPLLTALAVTAFLLLSGGQAHANHVQCGDVITQDTTLDADLIDCPGDALIVGADDITVDLAGHTVGVCCSAVTTGLTDTEHRGVVIENGKLLGQIGIRLSDAHETVLRDLDVFGGPAITLNHSTDNRLERSTVRTGYVALSLDDSGYNEIRESTIMGYYYGIDLEAGSDHNRIENSNVSAERYGPTVLIQNSGFNSVRQDQLRSSFSGVGLIDAEGNEVTDTTSRVNDSDVFLVRSDGNLIARTISSSLGFARSA
jgi:Periplasmic copper-binding protein (NosD)